MNHLVVSRYTEDLHWLCAVPQGWKIHVYNKGAPISSPLILARVGKVRDMENVGRESETFLSHMLNWRGEADGFTAFCQGDPFEHSPDFIQLLDTTDQWRDVQTLSYCWKESARIPPALVLESDQAHFVNGLRVRPEQYTLGTWNPLSFIDVGAAQSSINYLNAHGAPSGTNVAAHFLRLCDLNELADEAEAHQVGTFAYGGMFAIRSHLIGTVPLSALRLMREIVKAPACHGYVMERLWLHLFGEKFLLPASRTPAKAAVPARRDVLQTV